ncbi:MAG: double-strand break repair protein AddB [Alphaproteobacteria bacterium]
MTGRPNVFTIAPGVPFVDALAAGVMAGALGIRAEDGGELSRVTILLPTRRAARALIEAFLRQSGGRPMILPRIAPIGEVDEDRLEPLDGSAPMGGLADVPPAVSPLRRHLLLTRLVVAFARASGRPFTEDRAARLARELALLLDQVQTERLSFDALSTLVPEDFARHWEVTLDFLDIVTRAWPQVLAEEGAIDPAVRRNLLLEAQARAWLERPPAAPVIAAGSTGSVPATADLLSAIASLAEGAVVLPGLDRTLDDAAWDKLDETHPQYTMARLLARLGVARSEVRPWDAPGVRGASPLRAAFVSEALRPADTTDAWSGAAPPAPEALAGLCRIDCPSPREEAGAIALLMREALETEGKRAALVTFDRELARRVAAELGRFGIDIDDSAGTELALSPCGTFLRATAAMVAEKWAPVALLSALKHPLAAGGESAGGFRAKVRLLERLVLRGPRPAEGLKGLIEALKQSAADKAEKRALSSWLRALGKKAQPLSRAMGRKRVALVDLAAAHLAFAEALAEDEGGCGAKRLWAETAGETAAVFFSDLMTAARDLPPIAPSAYGAFLDAMMEGQVVRPPFGRHPRLFIWGPLEARLQHVERIILGGLNEGTWPPKAHGDAWMSRPMRRRFGLPLPERRIGLSAHDFAQLVAAGEVFLTRSTRVEGTPTVASRWLLRLDNLLPEGAKIRRGEEYLAWLAALDRPEKVAAPPPPSPRPPVAARPRRLSVTEIETLIRDPYAIYAKHVLGLRPLLPLDSDPGAAERGSFIHDALDKFVRSHPEHLPADSLSRLEEFGREAFGDALAYPGVRAFWWPRFLRAADWFLTFERARRGRGVRVLATEVRGRLSIPAPGGEFELVAKADRIDRTHAGLSILDYKTGAAPSGREVTVGLAPQLTLEAAMARAGAFPGIPAGEVADLAFVKLTGREPPGAEVPVKGDIAAMADLALRGLTRLIASFDEEQTPYRSRLRPKFLARAADYDHLARVKEWSSALEDGT